MYVCCCTNVLFIVRSPHLQPFYTTSAEGTAGAAGTDDMTPSGRPLPAITLALLSTADPTPAGVPI